MNKNYDTEFIKETPQKEIFSALSGQNFFIEWCKINDGIMPEFISRQEREQIDPKQILESKQENKDKQILLLPKDLKLWEISKIIEIIENDTFQNKPERIGTRSRELFELGKMLEKAAIYIHKYCKNIPTAQNLAQEFYNYGLSLQTGEKKQENIKEEILSEEEKAKIDKWLLGETTYKKTIERLGNNPTQEAIEKKRKELLNTYFTALERKGYEAEGNTPWTDKKGPIKNIQDKSRNNIINIFETPKRELQKSIFERGQEKLITNMIEPGGENETNEPPKKLYEVLEIDKLKKELDMIRKGGNIEIISDKELEIAKKIQKEINKYTYKETSNNPAEIVKNQQINCLGSAILGTSLLRELKIKCIPALAGSYDHIVTLLITSNGEIYWQDFTPWQEEGENIKNYKKIQKNILLENNINKENITPEDIIDWEKKNQGEPMSIKVELETIGELKTIGNLGKLAVENLHLYETENTLITTILNNVGHIIVRNTNTNNNNNINQYEESIEIFKQAIALDPKNGLLYNGLGIRLIDLGKYEDAIKAYKQGIALEPQKGIFYNGIALALVYLGKYEDAIKTYKQGIAIDPQYQYMRYTLGKAFYDKQKYKEAADILRMAEDEILSYKFLGDALDHLGKKKEALRAYQAFIYGLENSGDIENEKYKTYKKKIMKKIENMKRIMRIQEEITKLKIDFKYEMRKRISKIKKQ